MDIRPVKETEKPKYPLKEEVSSGALKISLPKRWIGSPAIKVALGTLAAITLAGCANQMPEGSVAPPATVSEGAIISQTPDISVFAGTPEPAHINVAPIFAHGEGRGAFGCDMVTPPSFISEDEALSVVNEAAKEYGLNFSAKDAPGFLNVRQPAVNIYDPDNAKPSDNIMDLKADFMDKEHGISIEYVSVDDLKAWQGKSDFKSSVEEYRTRDTAEQLSEALESASAQDGAFYTVAVLYDPCETVRPDKPYDKNWKKAKEQSLALSEEDIKAQSADFFKWLKTRGII